MEKVQHSSSPLFIAIAFNIVVFDIVIGLLYTVDEVVGMLPSVV
ncbi:hypothetical protein BCD93_000815 [Clostridium saccharoperbutylacetonicum]|nr:hypothetical protein [Clostridium saccharoperbutylacetonicum]